jgi:hypothetical protein
MWLFENAGWLSLSKSWKSSHYVTIVELFEVVEAAENVLRSLSLLKSKLWQYYWYESIRKIIFLGWPFNLSFNSKIIDYTS